MGRREWAVCAIAVVNVLVASLAPPPATAEPESANPILRVATTALPQSVFPPDRHTAEAHYLSGFIGRSLTIYDKNWAVACALCKALPTLDNHGAAIVTRPDGSMGMDVTFELDPGLFWDDGTPVTTADVVFSTAVAQKFSNGESLLSDIIDTVPQGDHRVTFRLKKVRFDYNRFEELFLLPAHLEKDIFEASATPQEYRARSHYTTDPTAPGLADGPFKLSRKMPDEMLLTKNPYWHGKIPHFDQILLRRITDSAALEADVLAGRIDVVAGELGVDLGAIYRLEAENKNASYQILYKPTLDYEHIDFNLSNDLLKDKRIRRAMELSLDRPIEVPGRERRTMGEAPRSFLSPGSPNFDPTLKPVPYDPARAAALFEEAGFSRGPDGIRVNHAGQRLAFKLSMELAFDLNRRVAEKLKDEWSNAGVEIALADGQISEILPKRQFDLASYSWANVPEFLIAPVYAKSGIPTAENGFKGDNFPGFDNAEMNEVAAALTTELDPGKRLLLWRRAQQIYAEEVPAIPLSFVPNEFVIPATMTGFEPTGHSIPTSFWVEDWALR
jgi:peptide/nickel transport system substrate-binding protein